MIYLIRPREKKDGEFILYICSVIETDKVFAVIEQLDLNEITRDDGIISYTDDPFLLTQINSN